MTKTHTIVVRYPTGIVPRYSGDIDLHGGQLVAVSFAGNQIALLDEMAEAVKALLENVSGAQPEDGKLFGDVDRVLSKYEGVES